MTAAVVPLRKPDRRTAADLDRIDRAAIEKEGNDLIAALRIIARRWEWIAAQTDVRLMQEATALRYVADKVERRLGVLL